MTGNLADLEIGASIPEWVCGAITKQDLAAFAAASGDHNPIHLDESAAQEAGLPGIIAHGMYNMAQMSQLLLQNVPQRDIRAFEVRFKAMSLPGDVVTCAGVVTSRKPASGETHVVLSISARNQDGVDILAGSATIAVR